MSKLRYCNFSLEYSLLNNGYRFVAGMDEVGRGCLAGPVVAAVVVISDECQYIPGVWDSKIMTQKRREDVYDKILDLADGYGIGESSCGEVDKLGISQAAALAMSRAYESLDFQPDIVLVDGKYVKSPNLRSLKIKKGDSKHFVISAASVVAKVYRDNLLYKLAEVYPEYGFHKHVGYGTMEHIRAIQKFGPCPIHRRSFSPVKIILTEGELNETRDDDKVKLGRKSEIIAVRWLKKKGFEVLSRNFRRNFGEVDIIARRGDVVYFVEVRSRRGCSMDFGKVVEAVDRRKLSKIARVGEVFVMNNGLSDLDRNVLVIAVNWYNPVRARIRAIVVDEI